MPFHLRYASSHLQYLLNHAQIADVPSHSVRAIVPKFGAKMPTVPNTDTEATVTKVKIPDLNLPVELQSSWYHE